MLQLHRHGRSVFLAIREDKWWDSIYFHILMDNLPVIVSLYSVNDNVFLSDFNTLWLHNVNSLCSFTGKQRTNYMWSPRHICMHIHNNVWFFQWKHICERECVFSKMGFNAMSSPSCSPSRVREPLLFPSLPSSSPRFSRANWKTSVIILVLAQIWWDQRWPAGSGRGADGCMLRGTRQRPFRF